MMKKILMAGLLCLVVGSVQAEVRVERLRVNGLTEALGIDEVPMFSWQLWSDEWDVRQTAYEITVTDKETGATVWNSGRVESAQQLGIRYEGTTLESRHAYEWAVTLETTAGTASAMSSFETAFMDSSEWSAQWIGTERDQTTCRMDIRFEEAVETQWLKLDVTHLGYQAYGDWNLYYLQFAEIEIYSEGTNVATSATFDPGSYFVENANWAPRFVNDGVIGGTQIGYTSGSFDSPNQHVVLLFNLKGLYKVDRVVLYPRQDVRAKENETAAASFPTDFTLQTSTDGSAYTTRYTAKSLPAPMFRQPTDAVPYYGRLFSVPEGKTVRRGRIYATALGVFTMQMNGQAVTQNRLEPGETAYNKTLYYSTYDVTSLLQEGENVMLAQVAGGLFNNMTAPDRYTKPEIHNSGTPALLAELFIDYEDGTSDHIVTDTSWRTSPGPVTAANWWGGMDYDASLEPFSYATAQPATVVVPTTSLPIEQGSQTPVGELKARRHEPIRVVEEWKALSVTPISNGHYVVDFGQNYAGTFTVTMQGKAGQTVRFQTSEQLNADGSVNAQGYYGGKIVIYNQYTFAEEGTVTWSPDLLYFGMRYMEVSGWDGAAPQPDDFVAQRMRQNVEALNRFDTSNTLINDIHRICRNSIESQMYNVFTDCPQREKIGWLDVPNQMYNSITHNFDFQTFGRKIVHDCFDAQAYYTGTKAGKVPSTIPHFFTDWDDDPNWGGSAILIPYRTWRTYGDRSLMEEHYDGMKRLINYYTSLTTDYIMPGSSYSALGDWGQGSSGLAKETTPEFTITCTYYYLLRIMSEMAAETGHTADARTFRVRANRVKSAFNTRFYNATTAQYEYGNQAELAMPLYYGLVEEDQQTRVAAALAEKVIADGYKIKTGECGLKPVLITLSDYGYDDIVWQMANQTDYPSYGYFVRNGCTTTPELWNMAYSQNHCMLDHIEEWFYTRLAGIRNTGLAYDTLLVAPYLPTDLNHLAATIQTVRGLVTSEYTQITADSIHYRLVIPANTIATAQLPLPHGTTLLSNGQAVKAGDNGIISLEQTDTRVTLTLSSGTYLLTTGTPAAPTSIPSLQQTDLPSSNKAYDLQGRPVVPPFHGLCIVEGKKVLGKVR